MSLCGQLELLKPIGDVLDMVEHVEEMSSSEAIVFTCLVVEELLHFQFCLPPHPHFISKKADLVNRHQRFNVLLGGRGEMRARPRAGRRREGEPSHREVTSSEKALV